MTRILPPPSIGDTTWLAEAEALDNVSVGVGEWLGELVPKDVRDTFPPGV